MEIRQRTIRRNFKKVITSRVAIPYTMQHRMKKYYLQGKEISEKQAKAIEAKNQKYIYALGKVPICNSSNQVNFRIMNEYTYIIFDHNGRRLGKIEFGVRNSVPSAKEIQEAIRDGFPNGTTYKLLVPTSVCINQ